MGSARTPLRGQCMPNGKRDWNQDGFEPSRASNASDKVFVGVNLGTAAFEGERIPLGSLQRLNNCLSHVLHMGWLQFLYAAPEHRINWKPLK
jgi:hypothetical protein